jgi:hypothetical protein
MGDNGCPFSIQPLIAVRVIEVPVGIDQVQHRQNPRRDMMG